MQEDLFRPTLYAVPNGAEQSQGFLTYPYVVPNGPGNLINSNFPETLKFKIDSLYFA